MPLDLKPTRMEQEYELTDEGGYRWHVVVAFDPEFGWTASVTMTRHGLRTPEAAVEALLTPVERFIEAARGSRGPGRAP